MILIADCGSTKVDWCVLDGEEILCRFETPGMNAVILTKEEMAQRINDYLKDKLPSNISSVFFYGAGCVSKEVCNNVADAIKATVAADTVQVSTDLLGAARALCQRMPGIACILGTGSNACFYDGEKIVKNVSPLGYILGDEGSGAVLGKILVGNVLKNQLPKDLCEKFLKQYDLNALEIIRRVYRAPEGNRFLASLTPFLSENIERQEIRDMTQMAFEQFFKRNVDQLVEEFVPSYRVVNFVGSIAHYFRPIIEEAAKAHNTKVGTILRNPMEGLIKFHTSTCQ